MTNQNSTSIGRRLRHWRKARRYSQMHLALETGTSSRHLSCIENNQNTPSKDLLERLFTTLSIPLRNRNSLLISAGFAPEYHDTGLSEPEMKDARLVLNKILTLHEPYPAMLINGHWEIEMYNDAFAKFMLTFLEDKALANDKPLNLLRIMFHPSGWAPHLVNIDQIYETYTARAERSLAADKNNHKLADLLNEVSQFRTTRLTHTKNDPTSTQPQVVMPAHFRKGELEVKLFTTVTTLGTPENITLQELKMECGYPVGEEDERFFKEY